MTEQLDMRVVHETVESRVNELPSDFQLAAAELAGLVATNGLDVPPIELGTGTGYIVHSGISGSLTTGPVRFENGNFVSDPSYDDEVTAKTVVVGLWPLDGTAAVYHVSRPLDGLELTKETPAIPILQHVLESRFDLSMEPIPGSPDDVKDLYIRRGWLQPFDYYLTEQTRVASFQVGEASPNDDEGSDVQANITLEGPVEIEQPMYYIKLDERGVHETPDLAQAYLEVTLPAELLTFTVDVPQTTSQVLIRNNRLIAVRQGFEQTVLQDKRTVEALRADAQITPPHAVDPLYEKFGITILPHPKLDTAAHRTIADTQGWQEWEDFPRRYPDAIEARVHSEQLREAQQQARQIIIDALHGNDAQAPTEATVTGALAVADYIRTQLKNKQQPS